MKSWFLGALGVVAMLGTVAVATPALAQHESPLDFHAVFKTHVPHANTSVGGGGGPSATAQTSAPAASISGTSYTVGSTVTPTNTLPEAEEHIAVDPANSANLLAAISDFSLRGGWNTTKYAYSSNNGSTWGQAFVPLDASGYPTTSDGFSWQANSDPVVANDTVGNVYLADLYFNGSNNANGFYVSVAARSGGSVSFTQAKTYPVLANYDPSTNVFEDKEWIAVDNSTSSYSGTVYVSWTHFIGNSDMIYFSRSTNHGASWSSPKQISPGAQNGAVQGSQVAVGPSGEIYIVYEVYYVGGKRAQFIAKSTDGGGSFSSAAAITPLFNDLRFNSTYRKNSFASLAVSPSGHVYVVYSDQPNGTVGAQVEFISSATGLGGSFSAPVAINDVSFGQQFFPAVTVDSSGVIHASWFDTRNSSSTSQYDIYATYSVNNGSSFATNARVTSAQVNAGSSSFIGDYAGIAAGGGDAHPVWTSGGFNNGLLQTAALCYVSGCTP